MLHVVIVARTAGTFVNFPCMLIAFIVAVLPLQAYCICVHVWGGLHYGEELKCE